MWVSVMISVWCAKNTIFLMLRFFQTPSKEKWDKFYVKLCMIVLLMELYFHMPLSVTMTILQGHNSVRYFWLKVFCFYLQTRFKWIQTLHDCNFAWGLPVYSMFDAHNLVSRSYVSETWTANSVFSSLVQCSLNAGVTWKRTYTVSVVYLREISNTFSV